MLNTSQVYTLTGQASNDVYVTRGSQAEVLISDPAAGEWRLQCPF